MTGAVVRNLQVPIWVVTIGMLAIIFTPIAGADAYGATRWISIGPFSFQPSEFAKITIRLDDEVINYFKNMAEETGMPYQNIINYYLKDCVKEKRHLEVVGISCQILHKTKTSINK